MFPLYQLTPIVLTIQRGRVDIREEVSGNVLTIQCDWVVVTKSLLPTSPMLKVKYGTLRLLSSQPLVPIGNIAYVVASVYPLFDL